MNIIRELGAFERAQVISEIQGPFHIVGVIFLENGPLPPVLHQSLIYIHQRHPFLSSRVVEDRGRLFFESLEESTLPFQLVERENEEHWITQAETMLTTPLDRTQGIFLRCSYLYHPEQNRSEIILAISHIIADAVSTYHLLHEILVICASILDGKMIPAPGLLPAPSLESCYPPEYRGWRMTIRKMRYFLAQMLDELNYHIKTRGKQTPQVPSGLLHGHILSLQLEEDVLETFAHRARREGVTTNSALNAAILLAVNQVLYAGKELRMRTMSFADMRPHVIPKMDAENLGLYISANRYSLDVGGKMDFWMLAGRLHRKIYRSLKSGDKYVSAVLSELLLKTLDRLQNVRTCASAMSYGGLVPLRSEYGSMRVTNVHGYISPFKFGSEFSALAHLFNGRLILNFVYADEDMGAEQAKEIIEKIGTIVRTAIK